MRDKQPNEQMNIEQLSQWKLEAEFRNFSRNQLIMAASVIDFSSTRVILLIPVDNVPCSEVLDNCRLLSVILIQHV